MISKGIYEGRVLLLGSEHLLLVAGGQILLGPNQARPGRVFTDAHPYELSFAGASIFPRELAVVAPNVVNLVVLQFVIVRGRDLKPYVSASLPPKREAVAYNAQIAGGADDATAIMH